MSPEELTTFTHTLQRLRVPAAFTAAIERDVATTPKRAKAAAGPSLDAAAKQSYMNQLLED